MRTIFVTSFLAFLWMLLPQRSISQTPDPIIISSKHSDIGNNLINGSVIQAIQLEFDKKILDCHLDQGYDRAVLIVQNVKKKSKKPKPTGLVVAIDLKDNSIIWSIPIHLVLNTLRQSDRYLIIGNSTMSCCYDKSNGRLIWEQQVSVLYFDDKMDVCLAYLNKMGEKLLGIEMRTGKNLWKRTVDRDCGWNNLIALPDSNILIAASGLHKINLRTGTIWDYDAVTGEYDHLAGAAKGILGVAIGLGTGYAPIIGGSNYFTGLVSNILIENGKIYFASKDSLACIHEKTGEILWSEKLMQKKTGRSEIFIHNDTLFLVNYALAYKGYSKHTFGNPYIAAFDLHTGNKFYYYYFPENTSHLNDCIFKDGNFYLLNDKFIEMNSATDGSVVKKILYQTSEVNNLKFFSQPLYKIYPETNEIINPEIYSKYLIVNTSDKRLNIFDSDLKEVEMFPINDIYIPTYKSDEYTFIRKDSTVFLMSNENQKIAQLFYSGEITSDGDLFVEFKNFKLNLFRLPKPMN